MSGESPKVSHVRTGLSMLALSLVLAGVFGSLGIARHKKGRTGRVLVEQDAKTTIARGIGSLGEAENSYPRLFFQKGVNFTAEYPDIYGSHGADERLMQLKKYGVNAVAIVPYGFASENSTRIRFNLGWERDSGVEELAAAAHREGIKVLLKPQLYVRDGFPGSLEYSLEAERKEWFEQYRIFVEHYATLATHVHADLFCVGVELDKLSEYSAEWRSLIARVRELYPGPLVYAANYGDEFESVEFWDALDYIGMDEYFSLPDSLSTDALVAKVEAVQNRFHRPVIFTEVGFPSVEGGNRNPWDEPPREVSLELQARCYEQIFRAFYGKPWFEGMYWWKVGTNGFGGPRDRSHTPWGKPAMEVVRRWYTSEVR